MLAERFVFYALGYEWRHAQPKPTSSLDYMPGSSPSLLVSWYHLARVICSKVVLTYGTCADPRQCVGYLVTQNMSLGPRIPIVSSHRSLTPVQRSTNANRAAFCQKNMRGARKSIHNNCTIGAHRPPPTSAPSRFSHFTLSPPQFYFISFNVGHYGCRC